MILHRGPAMRLTAQRNARKNLSSKREFIPSIKVMMFRRILLSGYIGFLVFITLSLFFAQGGLLEARDLSFYKSYLEKNIEDLKEINQDLTQELKALSTSPDTLKLHARDYGYYEKDERVIKVQGAPQGRQYYKLGTLLKRNSTPPAPNPAFHLTGIGVALTAFVLLTLRHRKQRYKKITVDVSS